MASDGIGGSTIAELIVEARHRGGLTQAQLASASGIVQPNISAYESGRRSPSVRTLLALLDACGARLMLAPDVLAPTPGFVETV